MTETTVPPADARGEPIQRAAADLVVGDRIAAGFLPPLYKPAVVEHVARYQLSAYREAWALVTYREDDGRADASHFLGEKLIPLEACADDGMGYSRDADDPTPVSGARGGELHHGAMTDGGLVDETEAAEARQELAGRFRRASHPGVIAVAGGHVVHECCGVLDDAPHQNFCAEYVPSADTVPVPAEDATLTPSAKDLWA